MFPNRCAKYPNLPSSCTMVSDPNDKCCEKPYCTPIKATPAPTPAPGVTPTPSPGKGFSKVN